jgi:cytochrome c oxidase subunit 1
MASISIPASAQDKTGRGILSWVATVDHKKVGIMYILMAFCFFILSGLLALVIRTQLALPGQQLIDPDTYNQVFTMHGTGMIFLFTIPMLVGGFGNYFLPIMIGARDVAFPRLNAFSFWITLGAGLIISIAFVLGDRSNAAWTAYVPLSTKAYSPQAWICGWSVSSSTALAAHWARSTFW